jgi:hypothetical protein
VFLLVTAFAPLALAQEPPPLPPPEKPAEKPKDVVIEYVPSGSSTPDASPRSPSDQPPPPPPAVKEDEGKSARTSVRVEGGFQYSQLFGVPITGARVRIGAGAQTDSFAHYGTVSVLYGGTENDLRTWDFRVGYTGDFLRVSILRLGLDAEMGYLVIHRASLDERMFALGVGAGAHAGLDIVAFGPHGDHAVTAQARFDASLHFGGAFVWGPAVLIGFRY